MCKINGDYKFKDSHVISAWYSNCVNMLWNCLRCRVSLAGAKGIDLLFRIRRPSEEILIIAMWMQIWSVMTLSRTRIRQILSAISICQERF